MMLGMLDEELFDAVEEGDIAKVKSLLKRGANVNAGNKDGLTPLHFAAIMGHVELVRLLLENGADPEIKNKSGISPLDLAKDERTAKLIRDFMSRPVMIVGLDYSELTAGKWGKISVKVKASGSVSLKLEGDLDYVAPEESRLSGISSIEVFVKPRTSGELPLKVTVESSGVRKFESIPSQSKRGSFWRREGFENPGWSGSSWVPPGATFEV